MKEESGIVNSETINLINQTKGELGFSRTTLIIGAGAHAPYGFPTGKELFENFQYMHPDFNVNDVHQLTADQKQRYEHFHNHFHDFIKEAYEIDIIRNLYRGRRRPKKESEIRSFIKKEFNDFINNFVKSRVRSIDQYLSIRTEQNKEADCLMGKYLIASILRYYEKKTNFTQDWIEFFMDYFFKDEKKRNRFFESPPSIITFNYDVFFEQCMFERLTRLKGIDKQQAINLIKKLDIYHVYGHINSLDKSEEHEILESIRNLKVMGEEKEDIRSRLKEKLKVTKYLYFLGFGFNQHNMELLFPDKNYSQHWDRLERNCVNSTKRGISEVEYTRIQSSFGDILPSEEIDCLRLLEEKMTIHSEDLSRFIPKMHQGEFVLNGY